MVVPAIGFLPSEVRRLLVYAKARNFRALARIEPDGCLCLSPAEGAFGATNRLSATSS